MKRSFQKIAFFLWPPYEAYVAKKFIESHTLSSYQDNRQKLDRDIRRALKNKRDIKQIELLARQVYQSEEKRGEYLESKAQTFITSLGLSLSIVSALPVLFDAKSWGIPIIMALIIGLFYSLSIVHFFVAVSYSINTRGVQGLALPNVDEFLRDIKMNKVGTIDRLITDIVRTKYNEPILLLKSNSLSVSEIMFGRGLLFVAIASILVVIIKLLVEFKLI
jgi:hypothetical protein